MNRVKTHGTIIFDLDDKTKKHKEQSSWKKTAFVLIGGDECQYYSWFLEKRYGLKLNIPLRLSHISFINDSMKDLSLNGQRTNEETHALWEATKLKWGGKEVPIILDVNPKTDDRVWWLNIPHEERGLLQGIREELGLARPFWGMHMSIGYANEKNLPHSIYIHDLIKKGFIK